MINPSKVNESYPEVGNVTWVKRLSQGPSPLITDSRIYLTLTKLPLVEIGPSKIKPIPDDSYRMMQRLFWGLSLFLHFGLLVGWYQWMRLAQKVSLVLPKTDVVEVTFGIPQTEIPDASAVPAPIQNAPEAQEATKSAKILPQLPKQVEIEVPSPSKPLDVPKSDVPLYEVKPTPVTSTRTPPPKNVKTITAEEALRRAEKEKRKVGEKDQNATEASKSVPDRRKAFGGLPADPTLLDPTQIDAPAAPAKPDTSALPSGSLSGSSHQSKVEDAYRQKALAYVRRFWITPEIQKFDPALEVTVLIEINSMGELISEAQVVKSSGDSEFDEAATRILSKDNPFPELPKELYPSRVLRLRFTPKGIK
jgi:TonB family protein